MPGMEVRFNHPRQHEGIVCDDVPRLGFALDIENAQATLIVQKSTAHEQLPGRKNLSHIRGMFAIEGELIHRFYRLPGWARSIDHDKHCWFSFANHPCTIWYKAL